MSKKEDYAHRNLRRMQDPIGMVSRLHGGGEVVSVHTDVEKILIELNGVRKLSLMLKGDVKRYNRQVALMGNPYNSEPELEYSGIFILAREIHKCYGSGWFRYRMNMSGVKIAFDGMGEWKNRSGELEFFAQGVATSGENGGGGNSFLRLNNLSYQ